MKNSIRYEQIIENDRCILRIKDYPSNEGTDINYKFLAGTIIDKIKRDDIKNLSILNEDPSCNQNLKAVAYIIKKVRESYKDIKVFVFTKNTYENLYKQIPFNEDIKTVLDNIDCLKESENQRIIDIKKMRDTNSWNSIILYENKGEE